MYTVAIKQSAKFEVSAPAEDTLEWYERWKLAQDKYAS